MTFTFNPNIPATNNNPSVDQPDMLTNNVSTNGILNVDHITFNDPNGGTHKQMHLPAFTAPVVVSNSGFEGSVLYSKAGTADNTRAQLFFKNDNTKDCPVSIIKAYCVFNPSGAGLNISQSINIDTGTSSRGSAGNYTFNINANVLTGTNYTVFVTYQTNIATTAGRLFYGVTIVNATQFTLAFTNVNGVQVDPSQVAFAVLQM